ncbi:hypothetical protein ABFS82_06G043100 [Erythranthe guttata]|uniref:DUF4408 domain-containing protein n=1 Tax=Erythranthe guttata TaxID=4155 RepID=A0A022Q8L6_ERYGU|nr:hypothetical protein MIMGU_mgv1a018250mg [Erythranthe guttata]
MLDSTIELISMAASNSLAVFCFCNLIIAILLVGSSKPISNFDEFEPKSSPTIVVHDVIDDVIHDNLEKNAVLEADNDLVQTEEEKVSSVTVSIIDTVENEDEDEDEETEDEELRKKFEEFIERTNRAWRAEKMKTHSLVQ